MPLDSSWWAVIHHSKAISFSPLVAGHLALQRCKLHKFRGGKWEPKLATFGYKRWSEISAPN